MNIEKRDMVPKSQEELDAFMEDFKQIHNEVAEMLRLGEAYFQDKRD